MKVMWIGHSGLLFISGKHKLLIDPYLSNSLRLVDRFFWRKTAIKSRLYSLKPDVIAITSSQIDRNDLKSIWRVSTGPFWFLGKYNLFYRISRYRPTILASREAYDIGKKGLNLRRSPFTVIEAGVEWSVGDMTILAVPAVTSDLTAFGLIITDNTDGRKYYVASNTLYSQDLIDFLPKDIYAAFIPIGGMFGSMNAIDASRFAKALNPKYAIPVQFGTIDRVKPDEFTYENKVVPKIYKIIDFDEDGGVSVSHSGLNIFYNEKRKRKKKLPKELAKELKEEKAPLLEAPKKLKTKSKKAQKPKKDEKEASQENALPPLENEIIDSEALISADEVQAVTAEISTKALDDAPALENNKVSENGEKTENVSGDEAKDEKTADTGAQNQ